MKMEKITVGVKVKCGQYYGTVMEMEDKDARIKVMIKGEIFVHSISDYDGSNRHCRIVGQEEQATA